MSDFSIHIVTYNSADVLERCLEGVYQQRGAAFDVLIFDNASVDGVREIASRHPAAYTQSPVNLGYAAAHNRLIAQSTAPYILTLNPDVYLLPGFLAAMQTALDANPRLGSVAGCLLRIPEVRAQPECIDGMGLYLRRSRRQGLIGDGEAVSQVIRTPASIFGPDGAAAVYRRSMLEDIRVNEEYFDEDFFMHKEDVDVCWRARLRGWESLYEPRAVAHHIRTFRPGQRQGVTPYLRMLGLRNRYLLMLKNESAPHFLRGLLPIALYDVGIFAYALLRERASLAAYPSAWALRRRMMDKRRAIQSRRTVDWRALRKWFR